jgi:radical SAM superfamily enzyme YgiQ (UPF0313 family)
MPIFNIKYDEPLFRPPSEAYSAILQITRGCSWNNCAFCEMYTTKKFRIKKEMDIFHEIDLLSAYAPETRKVFLADGNAMVLSTSKLLKILNYLRIKFPRLTRVSTYAISKDLENKSEADLSALFNAGLKLAYIGIESGDDEVLKMVKKGETFDSSARNLAKLKNSGIRSSVMIINGLGGMKYSRQHAFNSSRLMNVIQPDYLSTLVLSFPYGIDHFRRRFDGDFQQMDRINLFSELALFIAEINTGNMIFRSDHASNYLSLRGILPKDKDRLLSELHHAIRFPNQAQLRQDWQRGL